MANRRFSILADNTPPQHKFGFFVEPCYAQYFTPKACLTSINFARLFKDVESWQSAKFVFDVTGVGKQFNNFIEHEIDITPNVYMDIEKLGDYLLQEITNWENLYHVKCQRSHRSSHLN